MRCATRLLHLSCSYCCYCDSSYVHGQNKKNAVCSCYHRTVSYEIHLDNIPARVIRPMDERKRARTADYRGLEGRDLVFYKVCSLRGGEKGNPGMMHPTDENSSVGCTNQMRTGPGHPVDQNTELQGNHLVN